MARIVNCPSCGQYVFKTDEWHHMNVSGICKKCKKLVSFNGATNITTIKDLPVRNTASGKRFI